MSFPKGADGGLDFGALKVFDEAKQTITLKNRGRYEIGYRYYYDFHLRIKKGKGATQLQHLLVS